MFFCPSANLEEAYCIEKSCFLELCADLSIWSESVCACMHFHVFFTDKCAGLAGDRCKQYVSIWPPTLASIISVTLL